MGLVALIFMWGGFVRSGLGFGGAALTLPLLLLIDDNPLLFLPLIAIHLLIFSSLIALTSQYKQRQARATGFSVEGSINWAYMKRGLGVIIVPKLIGVFGLLTLPPTLVTGIIFVVVLAYSLSYLFNKPFRSNNRWLDAFFLMLGGYISGTSLIGAPPIVAVFSTHVGRHQLRDTLFVLWFILTSIKLVSFFIAGVDMQWVHHLWLLPCVTVGHFAGLRLHAKLQQADPVVFYRVLGAALLVVSLIGLWRAVA